MAKTDFESVGRYIAAQPEGIQKVLELVRSTVRKALPGADEVISYQIPADKLRGETVIYFAAWKQHYSLYPRNRYLHTQAARILECAAQICAIASDPFSAKQISG
jgi:uncharacterized protein YdhG (YjbR/CyaY superfamily)